MAPGAVRKRQPPSAVSSSRIARSSHERASASSSVRICFAVGSSLKSRRISRIVRGRPAVRSAASRIVCGVNSAMVGALR